MMKTLYLVITVMVCTAIILFAASFFYLDIHRRATFFYDIYKGADLVSSVKLDKYNTEDQIVYKSVTSTPFHSAQDKSKRKLSINKKGCRVNSYDKAEFSQGAHMNIFIQPIDSSINFLAVGHSDFAYGRRLPVDKDFVLFESDAIISYFNLVDKYDFKKEGLQVMPALTHSYSFLPPYKNSIEVNCVGEEMITLSGRKMRSLLLRARLADKDKKEILIWLNAWTHVPLVIKIPKDKFLAVLTDRPRDITAKKYAITGDNYENRDVTFRNKDVTLSGTFSVPRGEGPFPAVILVWGPGPQDRDALGMFVEMADELARSGIAVLRFDKRGIGKSGGSFSSFTSEDMVADLEKAVEFLAQQREADSKKIAILGHSEGGLYAATLAAKNPAISACIILAGMDVFNLPDTSLELMWSFDKSALSWDEEYLRDIAETSKDTSEIIKKTTTDWTILLNKRIYVKKRRLDMEGANPLETIRKIKVPILIIGAKKDSVVPPEHIISLEGALKESGNENYEIVSLAKSNHFFGTMVEDGVYRTHLALDKKLMPAIIEWLNKKIVSPPMPEPQSEPVAIQEPAQQETEATATPPEETITPTPLEKGE